MKRRRGAKKTAYLPHIALLAAIFILLVLPKSVQFGIKHFAQRKIVPEEHRANAATEEAFTLLAENAALRARCESLIEALGAQKSSRSYTGTPARVIQRDPSYWDSFLWIEVSQEENLVNSPVLSKNVVIGVIEEHVGRRAKVRLITDEKLPVAVRVSRGDDQLRLVREKLLELEEVVSVTMLSGEKTLAEQTKEVITALEKELSAKSTSLLLAKGVVHGRSSPLWRSFSYRLVGEGFNYDFADEEGPARDLRTGALYEEIGTGESTPLICTGDVLVTTGYDGIFPKGLPVGVVTRVDPLEEGDVSYTIEAVSAAGNLHTIEEVSVLDGRE